jgi:hypothetical protein
VLNVFTDEVEDPAFLGIANEPGVAGRASERGVVVLGKPDPDASRVRGYFDG